MGKKKRAFIYVAVWMLVIFLFSAQVSEDSSEQSGCVVAFLLSVVRLLFGESAAKTLAGSGIEFVVRKLAHFSEYAVLAVLMHRALRLNGCPAPYPLSLLFSALYACTDEFHQSFVPGRSMELRDVLIDTSGAAFGLLLVFCTLSIRARSRGRAQAA